MLETKYYTLLSLILVSCTCTGQELRVRPQNTASVVNDTVVLQCQGTSDTSTITWAQYVTDETTETNIYINDQLQDPPNKTIYDVMYDSTSGRSDLYIRPLFTSGGRYRCQDFTITVNGFAHVTILGSEPECSTNATSELLSGQVVLMSCTVDYSSKSIDWPPSVEFTTNNQIIPAVNESAGDAVTWSLYVTTSSAHDGAVYSARVYFEEFTGDLPTDHAINVPSYTYSHDFASLNVLYGVENIQMDPMESEHEVGDSIVCRADGKPEVDYQWTDQDLNVYNGSTFSVTEKMIGQAWSMRCEACNTIANNIQCLEMTTNFTVLASGASSNMFWSYPLLSFCILLPRVLERFF